jgi:orotidine-5'-phosphate decarboxylase
MVEEYRHAVARIQRATLLNRSLVCCGLDPDVRRFPEEITQKNSPLEAKVMHFLETVVEITGSMVCAYKIQKAFFGPLRDGDAMIQELVSYIHSAFPAVPVILDCKIGDIDNTMSAYLCSAFDVLDVDGIVVNPYMGDDVLQPFSQLPDKAGIVLVRTSNPGARVIQDLELKDGGPLWRHVLNLVVHRWNGAGNLIPVISAESAAVAGDIRQSLPEGALVFVAGYGAQGGDAEQVNSLLDSSGAGVIVNSSRALLYPYSNSETHWRCAIQQQVAKMRDDLNGLRPRRLS